MVASKYKLAARTKQYSIWRICVLPKRMTGIKTLINTGKYCLAAPNAPLNLSESEQNLRIVVIARADNQTTVSEELSPRTSAKLD